jgi:His/Glu/Gln/Arg/opine family amino acid ABC transporter permease subunit
MLKDTWDIIFQYKDGLLSGLGVTLQLCLLVWILGITFGTIVGYASYKYPKVIGIPVKIISFILGGIPVLVFLFWLHYPVQFMLDVVIDPFITTVFTLAFINTFLVSSIISGSLKDFPTQYIMAAKVCGMSERKIFRFVQFPLLLRQIIPNLLLVQVNLLQLTLFGSLISVNEIFRVCQRINAQIYKPVEIYTALGLFFLLICLPLNGIAFYLKKKYTRNLSEK